MTLIMLWQILSGDFFSPHSLVWNTFCCLFLLTPAYILWSKWASNAQCQPRSQVTGGVNTTNSTPRNEDDDYSMTRDTEPIDGSNNTSYAAVSQGERGRSCYFDTPKRATNTPKRKLASSEYTVGWICAISTEHVAAQAFLDEEHEPPHNVPKNDSNDYTLGRIGHHNVVITVLPIGEYGIAAAAIVAKDMSRSFSHVRIGLMVGIGGGAPSPKHDIRLGDIVVSVPGNGNSGVFQYDFGKTMQGGTFHFTSVLNQPPMVLRIAVNGLKTQYEKNGHQLEKTIDSVIERNPRLEKYKRPHPNTDRLYHPGVAHPSDNGASCASCCGNDPSSLVSRRERTRHEDNPTIHYGLIASANQVMKDPFIRDKVIKYRDVLCFEMEAAGLMNQFPCLVIRGICDYSDSHKNKDWQGYAAMAAAAYARDLLYRIPPNSAEDQKPIGVAVERYECLQLFRLTGSNDDTTYEWYKERVEDLVAGTCQWFLRHHSFQEWLKRESGPLLISADPGCGKSVLAKYLVDIGLPRSSTICYFFFEEQDQNKVRQALCALLHQLLSQRPSLIDHALPLFRRDGQGLIYSTQSLWTILGNAVKDPQAGSVILVLDALDECGESDFGNLIRNVKRQLGNELVGQGQLKYLLTSRPYEKIISQFRDRDLLKSFPNIHIPGEEASETISQEVNLVITHQVNQLSDKKRLSSDIKKYLEKRLHETTHRTYLWVYLVFNFLEKEDFKRTLKGVDATIKTLPKTINEAYEQILNKSKMDPMVRKALNIMLAATQPLTLSEMNVAVNIEETSQYILDIDLEIEDDFKLRLRSWCGLFISIHHGKLYFLHQTAREFLLADTISSIHTPFERRWHQSFTTGQAHVVLATICVLYLNILNSGFKSNNLDGEKQVMDRLAFLGYTAKNWAVHFREADIADADNIVPCARNICDSSSKIYAVWFGVYWGGTGTAPDHWTTLMVSSYLGLDTVVKLALTDGADIEANDVKYTRSSLTWAACEGHVDTVRLLLEWGADIDTADGHGRTPLSLAAENGRECVVRLLLDNGVADINSLSSAPFDKGRSPLSYAAQHGHEQVVDMLLTQNCVTYDLQDSCGKTPLIHAVAAANRNIAHALIAKGANVSAVDHDRKGMLHHAINNADSQLDEVKILMALGAPKYLVDVENMTPLHYTVRFSRTDIAELLLRSKIPVDIAVHRKDWSGGSDATESDILSRSGKGLTPLHYAALVGNDKMVSFFLRHKANVNALSDYAETPLHLTLATVVEGTEYKDYWTTDHWRVEIILDIIDVTDDEEYDEAQRGVLARRMAVLNTLLDDPKADINIRDHNGETALHKVPYRKLGSSQFVERLVQMNAESTSRYRDHKTPLHLACAQGDVQSVSLLASRSQLALSDIGGQNALHFACDSACVETMMEVIHACEVQGVDLSSTRDISRRNALHCYAKRMNVDVEGIQRLLDYGVATGETDAKGDHPISVYLGRYLGSVEQDICRLLLAGVDPKHVNTGGQTFAQIYAVHRDVSVPVLKCLEEIGVPLSRLDEQGRHLLHHLALRGSLTTEVLEFILANTGIRLETRDDHGKTPLRYAEERVNLLTPSSIAYDGAVVSLQALLEGPSQHDD